MPDATHVKLICPVCKDEHVLEFACRFGNVEIYGCRNCGATLSVPFTTPPPDPPRR